MEKRLMFHRTNRCVGCVVYVYVGWIYQNMGVSLLGYRGVFVLVISNINIGFQKSHTLPLTLRSWKMSLFKKKKMECSFKDQFSLLTSCLLACILLAYWLFISIYKAHMLFCNIFWIP